MFERVEPRSAYLPNSFSWCTRYSGASWRITLCEEMGPSGTPARLIPLMPLGG